MGEIFKPAGQWIAANIPLTILIALLIFSIFFKIPKKEVHLLTWLLSKLGDALLGGVKKDIKDLRQENAEKFDQLKDDTDTRITRLEDSTTAKFDEIVLTNNHNCQTMQTRLNEIEKKQDMQTADRIRTHILNFAEDLRRGNTRTKEDFDTVMKEDEIYESIVETYDLKNNVYAHAIKFINKKYDEFTENDGFAKY